jgi:hypothetical protein
MELWLRDLTAALGSGRLAAAGSAEGFYPSITWNLGPDRARKAWRALASQQPSIRLAQAELAAGRLRLRPEALSPGVRDLVAAALTKERALLREGAAASPEV